ncbi:MAG TPA: NUMOD3 domain-containing DNA-binding protein [Candidatus Glassbacteria bacterium]|nr:NUMOD3 domain-containing DNA-binding protein [Candidatus Glassbacteria bacterium]
MKLCKCGCSEEIVIKEYILKRPNDYKIPDYIMGHNSRGIKKGPQTEEWKRKMVATRMKNGSYVVTEEHKEKIRKTLTGQKNGPQTQEHKDKMVATRMKNGSYVRTEESKEKISKGLIKFYGPVRSYEYLHAKAYKLFGKDCCEVCGKSNEQEKIDVGKRLSMHCTLIPKDYSVMEPETWMCVCNNCHLKIEHETCRKGVMY